MCKRGSEPGDPIEATIFGMAHKVETAREGQRVSQNPTDSGRKWQREIMSDAYPAMLSQELDLHRRRIRRQRDTLERKIAQVIQFLVKDHVGNIADDPVGPQVGNRSKR